MGNDEVDGEAGSATGERKRCVSAEDEEEGRGDVVVRSAGLNYPDVPAQIRLPVYAHNAVRNVQVHGQPPPATSSSSFVVVAVAIAVTAADTAAATARPEEEEAEEEELEPMYPRMQSVCSEAGHILTDTYRR